MTRYLVLTAAVLIVAGCGGAQSRLATHMHRGQAYFAEGNFAKASVEFRSAMQIAPKDVAARLMAGRAAEKLGDPRSALGLYQSVIDTTPDNAEARANLARLLIFAGAADRGLKVIQPGLDQHPDNAVLLTLRAVARLRLKDQAGALADVNRALVLAPANEEAVALRAGLYQQVGDLKAAEALLNDALRQLPHSTNLREILASLYFDGGDSANTEQQLRALVGIGPQTLRYRSELASVLTLAHRIDDAQQVLEDSVKALPQSNDAKLLLVDFIASQRTPAQGVSTLREFVARDPGNSDLRLSLAERLQRNGAIKEAIDACEEVVRHDGTGPKALLARNRLAAIALNQARYDDARKLLEQVLESNPHDDDALALRGEVSLSSGNAAAAVSDLRAVLRDRPNAVGVHRMLARAYLASGDAALAEQSLRTALDLAPADQSLHLELAQLLLQTHRPDQAVSLLEQAVHDAPKDNSLREALFFAYVEKPDLARASATAGELSTLSPDSIAGPYLAGIVAERQGELDAAQKAFERALALKPQAFVVLEALTRVEVARGQVEQAITRVKDVVEREPKNALPINLLGGLYVDQKNLPLAIQTLASAALLAPNWSVPYRNLGLAKFAAKDIAGGTAAFRTAIKVAPGDPKLVTELAQIFEREGRIDEAANLYEAWYQRNPQAQVIGNNLAVLLVTYRHDRASLDRARDLTAGFANSNDGSLLDTNGWVHIKRGEYRDALPILQRAAERAPDAPEIHYHLGIAELHAGDNIRAREDLEKAVSGAQKSPWSEDARLALASLKGQAS